MAICTHIHIPHIHPSKTPEKVVFCALYCPLLFSITSLSSLCHLPQVYNPVSPPYFQQTENSHPPYLPLTLTEHLQHRTCPYLPPTLQGHLQHLTRPHLPPTLDGRDFPSPALWISPHKNYPPAKSSSNFH